MINDLASLQEKSKHGEFAKSLCSAMLANNMKISASALANEFNKNFEGYDLTPVTTTAKGAQYINFETLKSLQTSSYDASLIAGITSLDSGVGGAGFTKMTAAQASKVTVSASLAATGTTFALADATGSSDVLNLTFKNATATTLENATALTVDGFETVNLTASSGGTTIVSKTAGTDYDQFKFSSTTGTTTVTLAGAFAAQVDISSNATGVTALNASANTADVSLVTGGQTGALVVTGSAGKDTITVNAVGTKGTISVDAGANDDTITVAAGALTNKVTINGGAGTKDTLANTASSAQDFGILGITNVETFTLTSDAAATDAVVGDFRNVTGLTTLKVVGGDATDTFTLNRLDGATVLEIGSATGVITTTINSGTTQSASFKSNVTAGGLTLDNGTTTLTVTSSDGDTTADEAMGAITTLAGSGLTRLVVLGDDRFDPGTVGTTVTTVDASGSTGGLTVIASSSATALIGGGAADTLTGGSGADTITGGKGADTIDGKGGRDTIVFATTGADNGIDVLTGFTVGSGSSADIFNFKNFLSGGSVDQSSGTGTAIVAYTSGTTTDINIANKVAFYSDATQANIDTAAEIAALIQGAGNAFSLTSGGKAILVTGDASGTNDVTIIWYVNDALDGAAGTISATDVVQVGYIGVTGAASAIDLDTLITTQFIFA